MKNNSSRLLFFVIVYCAALWFSMRFMHPSEPPKPSPQEITASRQKAEQLAQEAQTGGAALPLSEQQQYRQKKFQEALRAFDQVAQAAQLEPAKDLSIDVRLEKTGLEEKMAELEQKAGGSGGRYLDMALKEYRDLRKQFPHQSATITVDGKPQQINVYEVANARIDTVLLHRDNNAKHSFLYKVMDALVALTGRIPSFSYWFALLMLTLILKAVLYPFSKQQYKSMQDMQRIQPLIKEAQEKLKGRPAQEIQQRTMAIYRENNVNMAGGCLPAVVQMATLIPLYAAVRYYEYQFRHGTFLWIGSALSRQYPQFMGTSLAAFDLPLFALYLVSMLVTSRLTPPPADPQQAQQQKMMMYMMPLMFGFMMYSWQLPAAFTFYWLVQNVVSTIQQYYILKQHPRVAPAAGGSGGGGQTVPRQPATSGPSPVESLTNGRGGNGKGPRTPGLDARARARRKSRR